MKHFILGTLAALLVSTAGQAQQHPLAPAPAQTAAAAPGQASPAASGVLGCQVLTGRVTNHLNQPLTGATVLLRSRARGFSPDACITNAEGEYLISTRQPIPVNTVLEISAGGYSTFAQPLANCQPIEAALEPLPGTRFKSDGRIKKTSATGRIH